MLSTETKILIIAEMRSVRKVLTFMLKALGYENIVEAQTVIEGWQILNKENNIGMVFSDCNTPNCSSVDLLKKIRSHQSLASLPFVIMATKFQSEEIVDAVAAGVSSYLIKPIDEESLRVRMHQAALLAG